MPIHRGPRLDDLISRLSYRARPITANVYKSWPNLAIALSVTAGNQVAGAWVEFISAAAAPTSPFTVMICKFDGNNQGVTFEVGTGGAGSEVSVGNAFGIGPHSYLVPQPIPIIAGGTRVAVRATGANGNTVTAKLISILLPARLDPFNTLQLAGKLANWSPALSALSTPTISSSASSASAWTYGPYAERHSAAEESAQVLLTAVTFRSDAGAFEGQVAFATGASGSEVDFLEIPFSSILNGAGHFHSIELPIPLILPGSTRLAARMATAQGTATAWYFLEFTYLKSAIYP